jgi:hypothetical protein
MLTSPFFRPLERLTPNAPGTGGTVIRVPSFYNSFLEKKRNAFFDISSRSIVSRFDYGTNFAGFRTLPVDLFQRREPAFVRIGARHVFGRNQHCRTLPIQSTERGREGYRN